MLSKYGYVYNSDFKIFQPEPNTFSLSYNESWVSALFRSFDAAAFATSLDLNKIELLWKEKKPAELSIEDLKAIDRTP